MTSCVPQTDRAKNVSSGHGVVDLVQHCPLIYFDRKVVLYSKWMYTFISSIGLPLFLYFNKDQSINRFPPDLRLPPQPSWITAHWPVPNYTAWRQRHTCINNLPKVALSRAAARIRTRDLLITSPAHWPLGHRATTLITMQNMEHLMLCGPKNWGRQAPLIGMWVVSP